MNPLQEKFDLYRTLAKRHQDQHGFVYTDECDSLLWSSLLGCVPGMGVDIRAALEPSTGRFLRRPVSYPECYGCGESKSSISRDMLLGVAWYVWRNKRLDLADHVVRYALKHMFKMGSGDLARTMMSPALLATFAEIVYQLGGRNYWYLRWIPFVPSKHVKDYQRHLAVLHTLLRRELGKGTEQQNQVIYGYYESQEYNPLYALAAGDVTRARACLSLWSIWPDDRLPGNDCYSDRWIIQRDSGNDWDKSFYHGAPYEEFCGGDYLFCYHLLSGI